MNQYLTKIGSVFAYQLSMHYLISLPIQWVLLDQAENGGMATRGDLRDEAHLLNSRVLILKIDVIWEFMGAICLILVFKVSFSCI